MSLAPYRFDREDGDIVVRNLVRVLDHLAFARRTVAEVPPVGADLDAFRHGGARRIEEDRRAERHRALRRGSRARNDVASRRREDTASHVDVVEDDVLPVRVRPEAEVAVPRHRLILDVENEETVAVAADPRAFDCNRPVPRRVDEPGYRVLAHLDLAQAAARPLVKTHAEVARPVDPPDAVRARVPARDRVLRVEEDARVPAHTVGRRVQKLDVEVDRHVARDDPGRRSRPDVGFLSGVLARELSCVVYLPRAAEDRPTLRVSGNGEVILEGEDRVGHRDHFLDRPLLALIRSDGELDEVIVGELVRVLDDFP